MRLAALMVHYPTLFALFSVAGWVLVVVLGGLLRSRAYALFRAITLGVHLLLANALFQRFGQLWPLVFYLQAAVFAHSLALIRPRLRPFWYRAALSIPGAFFGAGTLFALPWAVLESFGVPLPGLWLPYLLAAIGVLQSLTAREEEIDIVVGGATLPGLQRAERGGAQVARPLRLVQITDPHLGPFMSVERLRGIAESAARRDPDLVVLTGDFLTMESQSDPALLSRALEPLRALEGRVFACLGNHDHEALPTVQAALRHAGATLLVDESTLVTTPAGPVQIVGYDFHFRDRAARLARVSAQNPRVEGALRLVLLHDPGAFRHLPEGDADLVLSGHTHGGQIGLVSLGLPWTMLRLFWKGPDHGFWGRGVDRLYVHRGTGHYGFPLRVGVPAENSLLRVHAPGLFTAPAAAE
jgi:predicted MPP superfamily phosphohydrolase